MKVEIGFLEYMIRYPRQGFLYLWLRNVGKDNGGWVYRDSFDDTFCDFCGITKRTYRNYLSFLESKHLIVREHTKIHVTSLTDWCEMYDIRCRITTELPKEIQEIEGFIGFCFACHIYRALNYMSMKKDEPEIAKAVGKGAFSLSLSSKWLGISLSTAHKYRKLAIKYGFLEAQPDFRGPYQTEHKEQFDKHGIHYWQDKQNGQDVLRVRLPDRLSVLRIPKRIGLRNYGTVRRSAMRGFSFRAYGHRLTAYRMVQNGADIANVYNGSSLVSNIVSLLPVGKRRRLRTSAKKD